MFRGGGTAEPGRQQLLEAAGDPMGRPDAPESTKLGPRRGVSDLRSHEAPIDSTMLEDQLHGKAGDPHSPLGLHADSTRGWGTLFESSPAGPPRSGARLPRNNARQAQAPARPPQSGARPGQGVARPAPAGPAHPSGQQGGRSTC